MIGDTEILVGPAKIRRLPPFGKSMRNRYIPPNNGTGGSIHHQPNFIPPHLNHQNTGGPHQQAQYCSMPSFVTPDGMFTWMPNHAGPYQKFPSYYQDANGLGYYQPLDTEQYANMVNGSAIITPLPGNAAPDSNNNKISQDGEIYVNAQHGGQATNSPTAAPQRTSPNNNADNSNNHNSSTDNYQNNGHYFQPHSTNNSNAGDFKQQQQQAVFSNPQPAFAASVVVNSSPHSNTHNNGEMNVHNTAAYMHHPSVPVTNGAFIPTTNHATPMFNNTNMSQQHIPNNSNSSATGEIKQQQQHPNFFYNGMIQCGGGSVADQRSAIPVSMGYPPSPVACNTPDMAMLAAGMNNMMAVPSYQYIPMAAAPPNMSFNPIPTATQPTTGPGGLSEFNNKPAENNNDAVNFTPISPPHQPLLHISNNAKPPQQPASFQQPQQQQQQQQQQQTKISLAVTSSSQPSIQNHSVADNGNTTANASVGLKAQNFMFMSTAPGKVNRVVVHWNGISRKKAERFKWTWDGHTVRWM